MCLQYKSFENTVGKGEIAGNEQFLLFHSIFYPFWELSAIFFTNIKLLSAKSFSLEDSKIYCLDRIKRQDCLVKGKCFCKKYQPRSPCTVSWSRLTCLKAFHSAYPRIILPLVSDGFLWIHNYVVTCLVWCTKESPFCQKISHLFAKICLQFVLCISKKIIAFNYSGIMGYTFTIIVLFWDISNKWLYRWLREWNGLWKGLKHCWKK